MILKGERVKIVFIDRERKIIELNNYIQAIDNEIEKYTQDMNNLKKPEDVEKKLYTTINNVLKAKTEEDIKRNNEIYNQIDKQIIIDLEKRRIQESIDKLIVIKNQIETQKNIL